MARSEWEVRPGLCLDGRSSLLRCFSTASPIDDDDDRLEDSAKTSGAEEDADGLKPATSCPKGFREKESSDAGGGKSDTATTELLSIMESSPFEPLNEESDATAIVGEGDALSEGLRAAEGVFGSPLGRAKPTLADALRAGAQGNGEGGTKSGTVGGNGATGEEPTTTPSLAEMFEMDVYTKSWSEPDREDVAPVSGAGYGGRGEDARRGNGGTGSYPRRRHIPDEPWSSTPSTQEGSSPSWDDDDSAPRTASREPSPVELAYNSLVERSAKLLERLSTHDDASTLQLMDFDDVMTKLSQFHSEVDAAEKSTGGGHGNDSALKQKASDECARLLGALEENYDRAQRTALGEDAPPTRHPGLAPNAASYNLALRALAHSGKGERTAPEAAAIVARMLDRCRGHLALLDEAEGGLELNALPSPPCEPTIITYNSALHAIAKSGATDAGHLAEEMWATMDDWRNRCEERAAGLSSGAAGAAFGKGAPAYKGTRPNARTLACVVDAWATANQRGFSPERAEAVLDAAVERRRAYVDALLGRTKGVGEMEDDAREFDVAAADDGVEEEVVDEELMEDARGSIDIAEEGQFSHSEATTAAFAPRPNAVAFNTCVSAWASSVPSRGPEAALRAQDLLHRMEALSQSHELDLPPGHSLEPAEIDDDSSNDVDSSLKPNVRTYSMVMNAWSNVARMGASSGSSAASHCEEILAKMEERGAVDAAVRPNLVSYVTCIAAWARTPHSEHAAPRAEAVLNRMIDLYYDEDMTDLPSLDGGAARATHDAPFNAVLTAYARSDDPAAPDRALAVLRRLEASPVAPTVTSYNAAMDVCAKHGNPERALEIFERMEERSIARDATSYDTVLNAFARADADGSAGRAYEFLCRLEEEHSSGESAFVPSSVSYSTVLNAFARASGQSYGGIHTVEKAKEIYDKLLRQRKEGAIDDDADPFANSCFLNCCANVHGTQSEKKEALILAITAFEDMKTTPDLAGEPNQYTFGTMMKACSRLSSDPNERNRLMESIFAQACKRGCVSRAVLGQFLRHTPSHLNARVILDLGGTKREIPESWHRNVPRRHWPMPSEDRRYHN
ncbi:hypothetical protein ACHAXT_003590 [Thalassiosira profunda]